MNSNKKINENEWLSIILKEYKSLREESLDAGNNAQSLIKFGMTAVSFVVAAGVNVWSLNPLPILVFLIFIPLLCYLILTIWVGEFARRMRAGRFIVDHIEKNINELCTNSELPNALYWESYVRGNNITNKNKLFVWNRYATISVFLGTAVASVLVGNYKMWNDVSLFLKYSINVVEFMVLLIVIIFNYKIGIKLQQT